MGGLGEGGECDGQASVLDEKTKGVEPVAAGTDGGDAGGEGGGASAWAAFCTCAVTVLWVAAMDVCPVTSMPPFRSERTCSNTALCVSTLSALSATASGMYTISWTTTLMFWIS